MRWHNSKKSRLKKNIAGILTLALVILAIATPASAEVLFHDRSSGEFASADFSSTDSSNCINTSVSVQAVNNKVQTLPGKPASTLPSASVIIDQSDSCSDSSVFAFYATNDGVHLNINGNSAILTATIPILNCFQFGPANLPCPGNTVSVDMTWSSTDPKPFPSVFNEHSMFGPFIFNSQSRGLSREAPAIGSVFDGTTNFTPDPSDFGGIGTATFQELSIIKTP